MWGPLNSVGHGLGWTLGKAGDGLAWGGKQTLLSGQTFLRSWSYGLNKAWGLIDPRLGAAVGGIPGAAAGGAGLGAKILGLGSKGLLLAGAGIVALAGLFGAVMSRLSPTALARRVALRRRAASMRQPHGPRQQHTQAAPIVIVRGKHTVRTVVIVVLLLIWLTPYTLEQLVNDGRRIIPGSMTGQGGVTTASCQQQTEQGGYLRLASDTGHALHTAVTVPLDPAGWQATIGHAGESVGHFLGAFRIAATKGRSLPPMAPPATAALQVAASCCLTVPSQPATYRPPAGPGPAGTTAEQIGNARTIVGVGLGMGVPEQGLIDALAASLQEARLRNLPGGDRDSAGLFQQRPSQGWGTLAEVTDPVHASTAFYMHLLAVPGWQTLPLTVAVQAVQRSGLPSAYADDEQPARQILAALTGTAPIGAEPVGTSPCSSGPVNVPTTYTPGSASVEQAIAFALEQLGEPYVWGAEGPDAWDCSGLVDGAYRLPGRPTTATLIGMGVPVPVGQEQRGDLLFTEDGGHVGIALGDGTWVVAPHTGSVVQVQRYGPLFAVRRLGTLPA